MSDLTATYSQKQKLEFAREMRQQPTQAERQLWYYLRREALGYRFHRQTQLAGYIVDFYCPSARVVIEIDGSVHDLLIVKAKDAEKERVLEERGLRVLRFLNEDVMNFISVVVNRIKTECDERRTLKALSGAGCGGGSRVDRNSGSTCAKALWNPLQAHLVRSKLTEFPVDKSVGIPPTAEDIKAVNDAWRKLVSRSTVRDEMNMVDRANDQKLRLVEWLKKRNESAALTVKGMHVTEPMRRQG